MQVTARALIQRINRKIKPNYEQLKTSRTDRMAIDVGAYFVVNVTGNYVAQTHVDLEAMSRELGVMQAWEELAK